MDIIKLIQSQVDRVKKVSSSEYVDLVLNHLERAELYLNLGKEDEEYFNDVIYRTNQAFEGALKESYKVLGEKTDEEVVSLSPFKIESYLKEHSIFKERVLKLFENYRQEWRNKTTHDFRIRIDESEAFLALINVSSFVHLLLKNIEEKLAFQAELERKETEKTSKELNKVKSAKISLLDRVFKLLKLFIEDQPEIKDVSEFEMVGKLNAFLQKADPNLNVERDVSYRIGESHVRLDFVIEYDSETILLEIKNSAQFGKAKSDIDYLTSLLALTGLKNGILFYKSAIIENNKLQVHKHEVFVNEMDYNVYLVV
jgi:hypothetical protein